VKVEIELLIRRNFWEDLDYKVLNIPISEKLYIEGDLNGHVGDCCSGKEKVKVHEGFGY
jgi:hypothetical protein